MDTKLYHLYNSYSKDQIFEIVLNFKDYSVDAIDTAKLIIKEKEWISELEDVMKQYHEIEHSKQQEIEKNAAYYRSIVEIKNDSNPIEVNISDVPKFEANLTDHNIEFHREDNHVDPIVGGFPTQTYYFKNEDMRKVDQISVEIGMAAAPYTDTRRFFKFETIAAIAAILMTIIALVIALRK